MGKKKSGAAANTKNDEVHAFKTEKLLEAQELLERAANLMSSLSLNDDNNEDLSDERELADDIEDLKSRLEGLCRYNETELRGQSEEDFEIEDDDASIWSLEDHNRDDGIEVNEEVLSDDDIDDEKKQKS